MRHRDLTLLKRIRRPVYAVYAISSLDTDPSLRHGTQNTAWGFVGTQHEVAGLTPRPFTLAEVFAVYAYAKPRQESAT